MFPFAANGRAMTLESSDGFVRVVARRDNHLIVGWQAVGRGVSELSTAFSHSIEMGARLEDTAGTIHAHPTLGEAVQEAALRALGHALHVGRAAQPPPPPPSGPARGTRCWRVLGGSAGGKRPGGGRRVGVPGVAAGRGPRALLRPPPRRGVLGEKDN